MGTVSFFTLLNSRSNSSQSNFSSKNDKKNTQILFHFNKEDNYKNEGGNLTREHGFHPPLRIHVEHLQKIVSTILVFHFLFHDFTKDNENGQHVQPGVLAVFCLNSFLPNSKITYQHHLFLLPYVLSSPEFNKSPHYMRVYTFS